MEKTKRELKYWLALGKSSKIGSVGFSKILATHRSIEEIFKASKGELLSLKLPEKLVSDILKSQENNPDQLLSEIEKREINIITSLDADYPPLLKEIFDPPAILYYKGTLPKDELCLGIIGSRKPTEYGIETTHELSFELATKGICIVSGMAIGIDTIAHEAALKAGGRTVAVIGCGMDYIYPSRNVNLVKGIIENGAVVSEFPIGVPPMKQNFPMRNRIISGLSKGILVTEAAERSGSLITANFALEQNRDVYTIPGSIYNKNSAGPHNLLKVGAKIVTSAKDILEDFELESIQKETPKGDSVIEQAILDLLLEEPRHIDIICKETGLESTKISSALTLMEISGKIRHLGGMTYRINN